MQPLDYRVEDTMQFVEVTGEAADVRLFAKQLIVATNKDKEQQAYFIDSLDDILNNPCYHHQFRPDVQTSCLYLSNKLVINPWSSKPSPYFTHVKAVSDEAWEKTIAYLQAGSDLD